MSPDKARHEDDTFQVPVKLPPQAVPLGQDVSPPVPLELPPVPAPPVAVDPPEPLFPPVAPPWTLLLPQPLLTIAEARATAPRNPKKLFRMSPQTCLSVRGDFVQISLRVPGKPDLMSFERLRRGACRRAGLCSQLF
jgi:hypothetical protein